MKKIITLLALAFCFNSNAQITQTTIIDTNYYQGYTLHPGDTSFHNAYTICSQASGSNSCTTYTANNNNSPFIGTGNNPMHYYQSSNTTKFNVDPLESINFVDTIKNNYDSVTFSNILYIPTLSYYAQHNIFHLTISYGTTTDTVPLVSTNDTILLINYTFKNVNANDFISLKMNNTDYYVQPQIEAANYKIVGYKSPSSSGIKTNSNSTTVSAFPNPNTGQFKIRLNTEKEFNDIMVYDLSGSVVYANRKACTIGNNEISVDMNVAPGMYLIKADGKTFKMFVGQ